MQKAVVTLVVLAVAGLAPVLLVANELPLWKEWVGVILGGIVSIVLLVIADKAREDAKSAKDESRRGRSESEEARREAQEANDNAKAANANAAKTEKDKKRERKGKR